MLRPSPNHGTQRLPNDDDDETWQVSLSLSQYLAVCEVDELCVFQTWHVCLTLNHSLCVRWRSFVSSKLGKSVSLSISCCM